MRPVSLTFSGLRSYRGQATIDFSSLDLFAVIGDTGAGKSTIIEALSLALYGEKTWSGGRLEQVIADGANGWSIELRFVVGGDEWTVTRARRRSGAGINKLECRTTGAKFDSEAEVTRQVTALLGLDHTQFLRAVVMPQGRFDELLRAKPTERTRILSSVFGLADLAVVRKQAETLRTAWQGKLAHATGRRDDLPVDPRAELEAARQRHLERSAAATALRTAAASAQLADREASEFERVVDRLGAALARVPAAAGDPATDLRQLAVRAAELADRQQAAAADRAGAEEVAERLEAERQDVLGGFADRDAAVSAATTARVAADGLATALNGLAEAEAEANRLVESAPTGTVPAELLERAEHAVGLERAALERVDAARAAVAGARLAAADLTRAREDRDRAVVAVTETAAIVDAVRATTVRTEAAFEAAAAALTDAKVAHSDTVRLHAAAAAAGGCKPGDPCPVCRLPLADDFTPPVGTGLDDAERRVADAEAHHGDTQRLASQAAADLRAATANHEAARNRLTEATDRLAGAEAAAASAGLVLDAADEVTALQPLGAALSGAEAEATAAGAAARQAQSDLTAARHEIDNALALHRRHTADAATAVAAALERIVGERRRTADLPPSWRPGPDHGPADLAALAERITTALHRLDDLDAQSEQARKRLEAAATTVRTIEAERANEVNAPTAALIAALQARHDRVVEVVAAFEGTDGDDLPPLTEPPSTGSDPAQAAGLAAAMLDAHIAVLGEATGRLDRSRVRLDAAVRTRDEVLTNAGYHDRTALDQATGAAEADARNAADEAGRAEGTVERADRLDAFLAVAAPFLSNLDLLIASLRDGKFIAFLVTRREAELTAEATRRLRAITKGRYGFVDGFGVVDLASGEIRTPDSLSGGERFQAALALALGLVEIASRGGGRLDAVFVDEGFGSLDAGALDVALETLGAVAGGGKMVALISHLRPVADYVDTVLHVHKDDVFGSRITVLRGEERERFLDDEIRAGLTG